MSELSTRFQPPWEEPEWREAAIAWIKEQLAKLGLDVVGEVEQPHIRPWSTVLRVPTKQRNFYFKAGGRTQAFEPGLLKLLNERQPQDVLPLAAMDIERGWTLLPDGGPTLRELVQGKADVEAWKRILREYAELQIAGTEWALELLATGIPDHRTQVLPEYYTKILNDREISLVGDDEDHLTEAELKRLLEVAPIVKEMCAELENMGPAASLEHGDLHDANIFAQRTEHKIFDWGDTSLSHPFFTLLIPIRFMADMMGISEYDPQLNVLRDTYLRPWTRFASFKQLLEIWELAHHLAKFVRTLNWYRVVKATNPDMVSDYHSSISGWFKEFLNHPTKRF